MFVLLQSYQNIVDSILSLQLILSSLYLIFSHLFVIYLAIFKIDIKVDVSRLKLVRSYALTSFNLISPTFSSFGIIGFILLSSVVISEFNFKVCHFPIQMSIEKQCFNGNSPHYLKLGRILIEVLFSIDIWIGKWQTLKLNSEISTDDNKIKPIDSETTR